MRLVRLIAAVLGLLAASSSGFGSVQEDASRSLVDGGARSGWFVPTKGWSIRWDEEDNAFEFAPGEGADAVGNAMRWIPVEPYRGRRVRLAARVEALAGEAGGHVKLWARVDRPEGRLGAFDNMQDRPIRPGGMRPHAIELDVDADAVAIAFGCLVFDGATARVAGARISTIGELAPAQAPSPPAPLTERGVDNLRAAFELLALIRFFHPSDAARAVVDWDGVAIAAVEAAEPATDAADLARRLVDLFAPIAPRLQAWPVTETPPPTALAEPAEALRRYRHFGAGPVARPAAGAPNIYRSEVVDERFDGGATPLVPPIERTLPGGVRIRLPSAVAVVDGATRPASVVPDAWLDAKPPRRTALNRSTRLAAIGVAWSVFRHFYPYFDPNGPAEREAFERIYPEALALAARAESERAQQEAIERLVAALDDGHGAIWGGGVPVAARLPVALAWASGELVVVGVHPSVAGTIAIGDVLVAIDGVDVEAAADSLRPVVSAATEGWFRHRAADLIASHVGGERAALTLRAPDGALRSLEVERVREPVAGDTAIRPEDGSELAPGIVYFDLDGAGMDALAAVRDRLAAAKGVVLDLRGYPGQAAYMLLAHLVDEPITSARWRVPIVEAPDGEGWSWQESGRWNIQPAAPRIRGPIAWLTDGRAISYAESILGIVEAYGLGAIVGATTAGTNGNVNPFTLPGEFGVSWTGMQVLKHDGSPHHGVGIAPTIAVAPTAAGIAARRDEVLERAVEELRTRVGVREGVPSD